MTAKEQLIDIIENGTAKQLETLIEILLLEGYDVFAPVNPQEGGATKKRNASGDARADGSSGDHRTT